MIHRVKASTITTVTSALLLINSNGGVIFLPSHGSLQCTLSLEIKKVFAVDWCTL